MLYLLQYLSSILLVDSLADQGLLAKWCRSRCMYRDRSKLNRDEYKAARVVIITYSQFRSILSGKVCCRSRSNEHSSVYLCSMCYIQHLVATLEGSYRSSLGI